MIVRTFYFHIPITQIIILITDNSVYRLYTFFNTVRLQFGTWSYPMTVKNKLYDNNGVPTVSRFARAIDRKR